MIEEQQLAGEHMTMRVDAQGTAHISFDDKGTGRSCGSCQLCCKLVPVPTIGKAAGKRCLHQKTGKGCGIYPSRPFACKTWGCRWLIDPEAAALPRPDRAHYVVDMMEDYVTLAPKDGGPPQKIPVVQVWIDPAFPEAHRQPALRTYMQQMAERYGLATIVRYSSRDAVTVFPPRFDKDGQWTEMRGQVAARTEQEANVVQLAAGGGIR